MTCIARYGNLVACDSKFGYDSGETYRYIIGGVKLYKHPTKEAVIAFSGPVAEIGFDIITQFIDQLIYDHLNGRATLTRDWKAALHKCLEFRHGSILIMAKEITIHVTVTSINFEISHIDPKLPIAIGSSTWAVNHAMMGDITDPVDIVKYSAAHDPLTAGKIYTLDLSELGELK